MTISLKLIRDRQAGYARPSNTAYFICPPSLACASKHLVDIRGAVHAAPRLLFFIIFVDPEKDDEVGIRDAFRGYKPTGQQDRIVALFIGLCTAAGLIKERQKESKTNVRSTKPKIVQRKQSQPKRQAKNQTGRIPPALVGLLESLPPEGEGWAKARRDKFYETFGSVLDFCIPIVEQDSRQEDDEE